VDDSRIFHLSLLPLVFRRVPFDYKNESQEGNTGFYYVRSSPKTIKLWGDSIEAAKK
jgi:hypothetical protein